MKKIITFALMFLMLFTVVGCKKDEPKEEPKPEVQRTYVADGEYTAYTLAEGKCELTTATVTIKDDKISKVYLNVVQSAATKNEAGETTGYAFNAQSKKELGYAYHMHFNGYKASLEDASTATDEGYAAWLEANGKLEWFQQAELIEAYIVANGVDAIQVTEGKFANIAGVTIKDAYLATVKAAIANAKAGIKTAVTTAEDDVTVATAKVAKDGSLSEVKLDVFQGSFKEGAFSWQAGKQEKGYGYHMHYRSYTGSLEDATTATEEGYKEWLKANNKLEWFEQAELIVAAWVANHSVNQNEAGKFDIAGVTIKNGGYITVLNGLLK